MAKKYLEITEKLGCLNDIVEGPVEDLINTLSRLNEDFGNQYTKFVIINDPDYNYSGDLVDYFYIYGFRKETEKERVKRLQTDKKVREEKRKKREEQEQKEYKLFLKLQEKFHGN